MVSGNDAAICIAEYISGNVDNFSIKMNEKAHELGLSSSHFSSPHGLDKEDHYTTAYELSIITNYALKNEKFLKIVGTKTYTIYINNRAKTINNTNELLGYLDGVYGVKTGFTNGANRCLVTACKHENLDIICIVLGCDTKKDRTLDSIKLINYVFDNYSVINVNDILCKNFDIWKKEHLDTFYIEKSIPFDELKLTINKEQIPYNSMAIDKSKIDYISTPIYYKSKYHAPLDNNTVIGKMHFCIDGNSLFSIDVLSNNTVRKKNMLYYFKDFILNYKLYL